VTLDAGVGRRFDKAINQKRGVTTRYCRWCVLEGEIEVILEMMKTVRSTAVATILVDAEAELAKLKEVLE